MRQCCKARVNNSLIQPVAFPLVIAGLFGAAPCTDKAGCDCDLARRWRFGPWPQFGMIPEAPGNSKNSTTFWGRLQKALFLATSIVEREHVFTQDATLRSPRALHYVR